MRVIPFVTLLMFAMASAAVSTVGDIDRLETIALPATAPVVSRVFVFTDVSCPYCALLHQHRDELLQRGIEIEYLFYPRTGPATPSFRQAAAVWCSEDRLAALDMAMRGVELPEVRCEHPIGQHYQLARSLELLGTPAVVTRNGSVFYGMPSAEEILENSSAEPKKSSDP